MSEKDLDQFAKLLEATGDLPEKGPHELLKNASKYSGLAKECEGIRIDMDAKKESGV